MNGALAEKKIVITGGTSRLGAAFVRKAISEGAKVYFTFFGNRALAGELEKLGATGFNLDLSNPREIDVFASRIKELETSLDVLIHNAAIVRDHTIQNLTENDWDDVLNVNLKAPYYLTKKLLGLLFRNKNSESKPSKIFMMTSRVAVTGAVGVSNYAAAKAGLIALAKSLAAELGRKQVLVNAVNPGFMQSKMTENLPAPVLTANLELSPLGRYSNPEEVAEFLAYLSSNAMTQVTGQVFHFESRKI